MSSWDVVVFSTKRRREEETHTHLCFFLWCFLFVLVVGYRDNVHRSEVVKNNLSPTWKDTVVELSVLCQGDLDKPVRISVFDHESSGKHVLMGQADTTVNGLKGLPSLKLKVKGKETGTITVTKADVSGIEDVTAQMAATTVEDSPAPADEPAPAAFVPPPASGGAYVPGGGVGGAYVPGGGGGAYVPTPPRGATFVDYVSGGCELNVCVAIDFTGSNGT